MFPHHVTATAGAPCRSALSTMKPVTSTVAGFVLSLGWPPLPTFRCHELWKPPTSLRTATRKGEPVVSNGLALPNI